MVLKKCNKCIIYNLKGEKLSEARVVHYAETVTLYLKETNIREAKFKAKVNFYDELAGVVRTMCTLVVRRNPAYPKNPELMMADCDIQGVNDVVQRQKDVRVNVHIETPFFSPKYGSFYGTISNLSAGGIYLVTRQILEPDSVISFDYRFRSLMRHFEVMALRAKPEANGRYGYGCCFLNLTDGADAAIRSFVFKKLQKQMVVVDDDL
ncbi:MAG: PilZ domain-containing protein [Lachnospiraceae bacterium]|jgi:hypothetical protein|nr:PilZ domain-containing protein [Lachnospiraceae bacterium]MCI8960452.1 PilZ domain-containing protein [Lachnospiraceae bacterium]